MLLAKAGKRWGKKAGKTRLFTIGLRSAPAGPSLSPNFGVGRRKKKSENIKTRSENRFSGLYLYSLEARFVGSFLEASQSTYLVHNLPAFPRYPRLAVHQSSRTNLSGLRWPRLAFRDHRHSQSTMNEREAEGKARQQAISCLYLLLPPSISLWLVNAFVLTVCLPDGQPLFSAFLSLLQSSSLAHLEFNSAHARPLLWPLFSSLVKANGKVSFFPL